MIKILVALLLVVILLVAGYLYFSKSNEVNLVQTSPAITIYELARRDPSVAAGIKKLKVRVFEDHRCSGTTDMLGIGNYSNKGKYTRLGQVGNDEISCIWVPQGLSVYMTDDDSFKKGKHGHIKIVGDNRYHSIQTNLRGKVSSLAVWPSHEQGPTVVPSEWRAPEK